MQLYKTKGIGINGRERMKRENVCEKNEERKHVTGLANVQNKRYGNKRKKANEGGENEAGK